MAEGSRRIRKVAVWFKSHAAVVLSFGLGMGFGVAIRYPAGWALPDNTASLIGALIGAFATAAAVVLGIELQTDREEDRRKRDQADLRMRIKIMLQPLFHDLKEAYERLVSNDQRIRDYTSKNLTEGVAGTLSRLRGSRLVSDELDNDGLVGFTYIEILLAAVGAGARNIEGAIRGFESEAGKAALDHHRKQLARASNALMAEVFEFAGGDPVDEWLLPYPAGE